MSQKIAGRNLMAGDIPDEIKNLISNTNNKPTEAGIMNAIQKTTTHINDPTYKNNCGPTGIANILSLKTGKQFDAKPTGGEQKNLGGILEECFKGVKVKDGFATTFGKSQEDVKAMLLRKFGNDGDCSGLVSVQWKNKEAGGHIFGWSIINGEVNFFDGQTGRNTFGTRVFWKMIDPNGALQYARLDNCEPIFDALEKYVDFT